MKTINRAKWRWILMSRISPSRRRTGCAAAFGQRVMGLSRQSERKGAVDAHQHAATRASVDFV